MYVVVFLYTNVCDSFSHFSGGDINDNVPVVEEDKFLYQYVPNEQDWSTEDVDELTVRACKGI